MNSKLALITFLDGGGGYPDNTLPTPPSGPIDPNWGVEVPVDPGYGRPAWSPVDPGYGQGRPPHIGGGPARPRPPHGSTLPVPPPVNIDNTLPEGSAPPQISLPIVLPPPTKPIEPDQKFELKYSVRFGWVLVAVEDETAQPK